MAKYSIHLFDNSTGNMVCGSTNYAEYTGQVARVTCGNCLRVIAAYPDKYATHHRSAIKGVVCGATFIQAHSRWLDEVTCKHCLRLAKEAVKKEAVDMSKLTFVEEFDGYSSYHDKKGAMVYLSHENHARLKPLADIPIQETWERWANFGDGARVRGSIRQATFLNNYLPSLTFEKEAAANIRFCGYCGTAHDRTKGGVKAEDGTNVCRPCKERHYRECEACRKWTNRRVQTEADGQVCRACLGDRYLMCRPCNIYYNPDTTTVSHRHDGSDCCNAPMEMMQFTMRNDGLDPVPADTVTRVTLPAGVLTNEGRNEIASYIMNQRYNTMDYKVQKQWILLGQNLAAIGDNWQTKEGNYPKRISRYAYKQYGLKISADVMSEIGNIGARHTVAVDFDIEFSREFDQTAKEWGHGGSCWWQSYFFCRCMLKSNGGVGIRSITGKGKDRRVTGRAWIIPLKRLTEKAPKDVSHGWLVPTFNTEAPDAFVVFNGYGNLEGYGAPRLLAHMQGMTYRKISMVLNMTPKPAYLNANSGYLVAPEEIAHHFTDGAFSLNVDSHANLFEQEQGVPPTGVKKKPIKNKKAKTRVNALADQIRRVEVNMNAVVGDFNNVAIAAQDVVNAPAPRFRIRAGNGDVFDVGAVDPAPARPAALDLLADEDDF